MTVDEIVALPYGESSTETPDLVDLLALPYTGGPTYSKGLTAAVYRERMRANGERVQWLRAIEGGESRQGLRFVTVPLDDAVRAFIYQNMRDVQSEPFGEIATGETRLSWMPDKISPLRDDRFVALDRVFEARQTIQPSGEILDALDHKQVVSIRAVYQNGTPVALSNYALASGGLMWVNGYLPDSAVVVVFGYHPTYELLGGGWKQGPLGQDGARLPSSAPLRLLSAGEE